MGTDFYFSWSIYTGTGQEIVRFVAAFQGQLHIEPERLCGLVWSQTVLTASSDTLHAT